MLDRPAETQKVFFAREFNLTQDDNKLLRFFENQSIPMVNTFLLQGYSKDAIADGMIKAINIWRNK